MIAAAQIAVEPEYQQRLDPGVVAQGSIGNVTGQFPRRRVTFPAKRAQELELPLIGRIR
jgi:hypothetical protein